MIAVRSVQDVVAGVVTIELPHHFTGKRVEVIVLPVDDDDNTSAELKRVLLAAPTLSDTDLKRFAEIRDWMVQWNVKEF